uniref:Peptidoglycan-associated lipoprotein n=1 Tax=uncultured Thiotrichaceae bacterium TaxID=298394 RepID=A0A6S6U476_9GAMM|nr:MAG: 18K peptidoglycan-associated outer membrane lipoprotein; Peptidoglycan-associated lipoprotein precursor; Outer membrane protein P6; OmpA/MotB precursor [uncultured Thiotrichaceae bacterium]
MNIKSVIGLAAVTVVLASGCSTQSKKPEQTGAVGNGEHSHGSETHTHSGLPGHNHGGSASGSGNGNSNGSGGSGSSNGGGLAGSGSGQVPHYDGINNGQGGAFGSGSGYAGNTKGSYTPADLRDNRSILAQRIIYFDYNQSSISPKYRQILDAHASLLNDFPQLNVRLEGHADERGSREYNVALSERRAFSVLDYMKVKGAKQSQADVVGYGEEIPATFGHGENSWGKNRRVEIVYAGE